MASIDVKGTVYWETGLPPDRSGRIEGAIVKFTNGSARGSETTNDKGEFEIKGVDDAEDLELVLLHEEGRSSADTFTAGKFSNSLVLRVMPKEGPRSPWLGGLLLGAFVVMLAILVFQYVNTHNDSVDHSSKRYAELVEALKSVPVTIPTGPDGLQNTRPELEARQEAVRAAKRLVDETRTPTTSQVSELIDDVVTYRIADGATDLNDLAGIVQNAVDTLTHPDRRFFWSAWPWLLVELWSWGLFGVLMTKIIRVGWYLRSSSYQANGTWMHISHVVATPFLAMVTVLLLSFLKIEGESQTIVDLGNPLFMVITAFLLSTNPWGLWDLVLSQGDAVRARAEGAKTT